MRRSLARTLPFLLAVVSCTLGGTTTEPAPGAGVETRLAIPGPEGVVWQREVAGETVLGLTAAANPVELSLMAAAFTQVPDPIVRKADIRNIVRAADAERLDPATLAFSRGPDIYVIDRTFEGTTRLELAYTLAHELAHIAQFNALDPVYVDQVLAGEIDSLDPNEASLDVADFIGAIGWQRAAGGSWFSATAATGTTVYGANGPSEDMAESVSLVATGRADSLSDDRVRWVENWTGVSADEMARGKPWWPPGAESIESLDPIYDQAAVAALAGTSREPLYLLLPETGLTTAELVAEVGERLRARGMAGVLDEMADDRLPRFGGSLVRPGGSLLWVEVWDFRASTAFANAPPGVVLTYVDVWG
jgi:hypothetical protein